MYIKFSAISFKFLNTLPLAVILQRQLNQQHNLIMITQVLENIGTFSAEELNLIEKHCNLRHLKKNEILLEPGQICSSIYFIEIGRAHV